MRRKPVDQAAVPPAACIFEVALRNQEPGSAEHAMIDGLGQPPCLSGRMAVWGACRAEVRIGSQSIAPTKHWRCCWCYCRSRCRTSMTRPTASSAAVGEIASGYRPPKCCLRNYRCRRSKTSRPWAGDRQEADHQGDHRPGPRQGARRRRPGRSQRPP